MKLDNWFDDLEEKTEIENIVKVLCGTKVDCEQDIVVPTENAMKMAREMGNSRNELRFFETSAKDGRNVFEMF